MANNRVSISPTKLAPRMRDFLNKAFRIQDEEKLNSLVEEFNNSYNYYGVFNALGAGSATFAYKDIPVMLNDPIIASAVAVVMENAFQTNEEQLLFWPKSKYPVLEKELATFHQAINAQDLLLLIGYNLLLWGNLPFRHIFNSKGQLVQVSPIADFTRVTPIILSGATLGYMYDGEYHYPYEFTYAQLKYYRNLGGPLKSNVLGVSLGDQEVDNEFTLAPSYLSTASKAWKNIGIIEDALLLRRMDMSNYYRILSVDVGTSVYSKAAIKVLNFYRNLFKKVRRVSYDSQGMSAKGTGNDFEVIVPKSSNQGVEVTNVGGDVDVKALADLEDQYNRLFSALRIHPSMIGFSSEDPNSMGDSPAKLWDARFAKVCDTVVYSALGAMKNIDLVYLRSKGYDIYPEDFNYGTVATSIVDDQKKQDTLKVAISNLDQLAKVLKDGLGFQPEQMDTVYLAEALLGGSLQAVGVDPSKLFKKDSNQLVSNADWRVIEVKRTYQQMVDSGVLSAQESQLILSSIESKSKAPLLISSTVKKGASISWEEFIAGRAVYPSTVEVRLPATATYYKQGAEEMEASLSSLRHESKPLATVKINNCIVVPEGTVVTVGELTTAGYGVLSRAYSARGQLYIPDKKDLLTYLYLQTSDVHHAVISDYREVQL